MSDQRFKAAVEAILKNWTALQMAVAQNAAGAESKAIAAWMPEATTQWFSENKDLQADEVEDFLSDIINQYFNILVQDGSAEETSKLICKFYALSNDSSVSEDKFKASLQTSLPKCDLSVFKIADDDEAEEVMEMEHNEEQINADLESMSIKDNSEPMVDAEGFTMVSHKKKSVKSEPIVDDDGFTVVSRKKK